MNSKTFFENLDKVQKDGYVNLDELAKLEDIKIIYSKLKEYKDEFSGLIKKTNNKYTIIINGDHSENRKRFTLAHELAHYFLHKDEIEKAAIVDDGLYRSGVANTIEIAANSFAAQILMPSNLIERYIKKAFSTTDGSAKNILNYVADKLKVSKQALAIRMGIPFDD